MMEKLKKQPGDLRKIKLQILCVGKSLSGKSSFIDSIQSALEETISTKATGGIAYSEGVDDLPLTKKIKSHRLKTNDTSLLNACIVDMPGFTDDGVINLEKIKCLIEGHVKMNNSRGISLEDLDKTPDTRPELEDKMHVVCIFLDNVSASDKSPAWEKSMITNLSKWLNEEDIPFLVILTKVDKIGPNFNKAMDSIGNSFRFKRTLVFPVQNYVDESVTSSERNSTLLEILMEISKRGNEYVNDMVSSDSFV